MDAGMQFGQLIKARRQELGLTQDELARRVGCASVTLRKIEYGDLRPSVQIAERLAMALNVPREERADFVRLARSERSPLTESPPTPAPTLDEIGLEDLSGRAIRGYALGECIGHGGFGVVYRAIQPGVEREVAIKIILPKHANNPQFIRRFDVEAQLVARLEHPHIVPLYDYWREPNVAYLVMRLLRGGNLQGLLKSGPLQPELTLRLLEQLGSALGAAHRAGIVHRDLKPSNVLLDDDRNAYLADFGIATHRDHLDTSRLEGFLGTPEYISPEQIRSEVVGPQTDIYCLGVMMYELLTGTVPFRGPTPIEVMHHHLSAVIPPLAAHRGGLPKAIDRVIERATAKTPVDRYQTVEDLITDFRQSVGAEWRIAASDAAKPTSSSPISLTPADNPYKGLRAFGELDTADFFGREALTQRLLSRLGDGEDLTRFLAVAGPSGSGKSSVVKAGLIPAIRRGALPGSENWFIVELIPGANPLEELELALLRIAVNPPSDLMEWLRKDERGLLRAADRCLPEDPTTELVLVIDQFEELFTHIQDESVRAHVLENLLTATLDERSRLQVIITLRADFVDRLLNYVDFGELIRQRTEFVLPLTADELERAIAGPAERIGLQIEHGVVSAILRDLSDQPGCLPLLQYALTELFEKREGNMVTKPLYQSIGGVLGALGRRAENVFTGLDRAVQSTARQLFLRLITLGEGVEDTRRRVLRSELESISKQKEEGSSRDVESVLDAFGRARLLTFDRDPRTRERTVELAHEALIRTWGRLREWLIESREDLRIQRQLNQAAQEWRHANYDPSFLATGARLARFEALAAESDVVLNKQERAYLHASIAHHQRREDERDHQQRRVLLLRRSLLSILVAALLLAIGLSIFAFDQRSQALLQADIAFSRQLAVQAFAEVEKPLGNDEYAALLAIRSLRYQYDPVADAALVKAADKLPIREFSGHLDAIQSVAISPDGEYLLTGSADTSVKLWEIDTGKEIATFDGHSGGISDVAFSPDGKFMLSGSMDTTAKLWDVATGHQIYTLLSQLDEYASVAFSPDGKYILTNNRDGAAQFWDTATGSKVRNYTQVGMALGATFSPDGKHLVAGTANYTATIWEVNPVLELHRVHILRGHTNEVFSTAFSPDNKYVVTGSLDNTVKLWDVSTGQEVYTIRGHSSSVRSVAFSPDGKYILTGSADRTVRLWEAATGMEVRSWRGHAHRVLSIAMSGDGKYIATGSQDGTAKLWDFTAGEGRVLQGHEGEVYSIAISPDGKYVLTSSSDNTAKMWDLGTGEEVRMFSGHEALVQNVAFSPNAKYALTGGEDGVVQVWDIATGQGVQTLLGHGGPIYDADFSPDGKYILTGGSDLTARLWDVASGKEIRALRGHKASVLTVAFSVDGAYLATSGDDATIKIWEAASGRLIQNIQAPDIVYAAVFSPDGKYLLTGGTDAAATLWDVAAGTEMRTFAGHTNTVADVAFSPDGRYAATASADRTARLWEVATGKELRTLSGHENAVWGVTFSPDGRHVWTASFDGTARLWEVNYQDFVANVCTRLLRDFTEEERAQVHITDDQPTCLPVDR